MDTILTISKRIGCFNLLVLLFKQELHCCCQKKYFKFNLFEICHYCLARKDIIYTFLKNGTSATNDDTKDSLFEVAIKNGKLEIIEILLNFNSNINFKSKDNLTSIEVAFSEYQLNIFELLIKNGANKNTRDRFNKTFLHISVQKSWYRFVDTLLKYNADVNTKCINLDTPLHTAVSAGLIQIVDKLLKNGADVNAQNKFGETPLHIAAENDFYAGVHMILEYYCNINIEDTFQETALVKAFKHEQLIYPFRIYVKKLKFINYFMSEKNKSIFNEISKRENEIDFLHSDTILQSEYEKEISILKSIKISKYTTLYHLLYKNSNEMAVYVKNEILLNIIKSSEKLNKKFPHFGCILDFQTKRGLKRKFLINLANDSLKFLTGKDFPDPCAEGIFKYLNDNVLNRLIIAKNFK